VYRIFVVEDDAAIAQALKTHLTSWEYDVGIISDFTRVTEEIVRFDPQLILLDITLPSFDGFHWCAKIREITDTPILFVSAADDRMSKVMAMNLGADDFVEKPYDIHVLLAKIRAMLRRAYSFTGQNHILEHQGLMLNTREARAQCGEKRVDLTKNELKILMSLMENAGKYVTRDQMMLGLWENDSFVDDNTLTVNVTRLRKKLQELGLPTFIETKKGIGYRV
jgi:two-component system, OmpR family, response regulator protein BraR/BceR